MPELRTQRANLHILALERRTLDGREYAVAPCVAVAAGVLNGQYLPAEEIAYSADGWNGRPVTVRHPKQSGAPVTANSPAVVETQVIGAVFNARMDGDRLRVELWVDVEKCRRLDGDALAVLHALDAATPLEVSTGYFCEVEAGEGAVDGAPYRGVQRNLIPDHIAVLPDEKGACSWQDGCGAPRVNERTTSMTEELQAAAPDAVPDAAPDAAPDAEHEAVDEVTDAGVSAPPDAPDDGREEEPEAAPAFAAQADGDAAQWAELGALINEMGGVEAFRSALAQVFDAALLVQEMGGIEAVQALFGALKANADEERADLVRRLAANAACAFSADDLEDMTTDQLRKLDRSLRPGNFAVRRAGPRADAAAVEWRVLDAPSTVPQAANA